MSGIFGFVTKAIGEDSEKLLNDMAHGLEPASHIGKDISWFENGGLGSVNLEIEGHEKKLVWNEDKTLCLVMAGELFDYKELKDDLLTRGHRFKYNTDAEFLLHFFMEFRDQFAARINGAFACAIWEPERYTIRLVSDHLGLFPLFYSLNNHRFLFATGVRALLVDSSLQTTIDRNAIVQFLTLGHLLDDRTYFNEIKLLPPASIMTITEGRIKVRCYWEIKYPESYPIRSETKYCEELVEHLRKAVSRQIDKEATYGILLSGGLDSRLLAALLSEKVAPDRIHAFTWGLPKSDDVNYAQKVASRLGVHHHINEVDLQSITELPEEGVRITDGLANILCIHALDNLEYQADYVGTIYKGFFADAIMGYYVERSVYTECHDRILLDYILNIDPNYYPVIFSPHELVDLFTDDFLRETDLEVALYQPILDTLARVDSKIAANKMYHMDLTQRQRRLTLNGIKLVRSKAVCRVPFCDRDLIEYMLTVPPGYRFERYLEKQVLVSSYPKLATIPLTASHLPLLNSLQMLKLNVQDIFRWHLFRMGVLNAVDRKRSPTFNYDQWFRDQIRGWMEGLLLSRRSLERGYFKPGSIQGLIDEQIRGENHAVQIGGLISLELMHRVFLD